LLDLAAPMQAWKLWFIQLEGWPVFLAVVAIVGIWMLFLSIVMTRLSTNRSFIQNAIVALVVLAVLGFVILGLVAVLSRI